MSNHPNPELNSVKNKLAIAYIYALAAKLNYAIQPTNSDLDGMGIDFLLLNRLVGTSRTIGSESDQINIQLKSVSVSSASMFRETDDSIEYNLTKPIEPVGPNHFLIVVQLLSEEETAIWIEHNDNGITLKKCAYYIKIQQRFNAGFVKIPKSNLLSPESLPKLFIPATRKEELI